MARAQFMRQNTTNRRQALKQGSSVAAALLLSPFFAKFGSAAVNQTSFTGFDGQSIVWGGVAYLPSDKAALPNIMPVINMKTPNGAHFLNQLLGKELFSEIEKTSSLCKNMN